MVTKDSIQLKKIFVEARHDKNLEVSTFSNKIGNFIRHYQREFPNSNLDVVKNSLNIFNPSKMQNTFFDGNRIVVESHAPKNFLDYKNIAGTMIVNGSNFFGIESLNRIGIRSFWGMQYNDINAASNSIVDKFIKTENLTNLLGDNKNTFHMGFESKIDNFRVNSNLMTGSEQKVEVNHNNTTQNALDFLFLDMDFYIDTPIIINNVVSTIIKACDLSEAYAYNFLKVMKGDYIDGNDITCRKSNEVAATK